MLRISVKLKHQTSQLQACHSSGVGVSGELWEVAKGNAPTFEY